MKVCRQRLVRFQAISPGGTGTPAAASMSHVRCLFAAMRMNSGDGDSSRPPLATTRLRRLQQDAVEFRRDEDRGVGLRREPLEFFVDAIELTQHVDDLAAGQRQLQHARIAQRR